MRYRIMIRPDDNGWWFVQADGVPGAHSQGQTLARARINIREAIALVEDLSEEAERLMELDERIVLSAGVEQALESARSARANADSLAEEARRATEAALDALAQQMPEVGLRDQADLVGLSFQRVAQMRPGGHRPTRRPNPKSGQQA